MVYPVIIVCFLPGLAVHRKRQERLHWPQKLNGVFFVCKKTGKVREYVKKKIEDNKFKT